MLNSKQAVEWAKEKGIIDDSIINKYSEFVERESISRYAGELALKKIGFTDIKQNGFWDKYDIAATIDGVEYNIEQKHRNAEYNDYMLSNGKYNSSKSDENVLYLTTTSTGKAYVWEMSKPDDFKVVKHNKFTAINSTSITELAPHYNVSSAIYKCKFEL